MGTFSLSHWLVVLALVLILFGAGRIDYLGAGATEAFQTGPNYDDVGLLAIVLFLSVGI